MASSARTLMRSALQMKTIRINVRGCNGPLAAPMNLCKRLMSSLRNDFEDAKTRLNQLKDDPGNETKLKIYALFKQVGPKNYIAPS